MDNEFRKENLSNGSIVQTRDGDKYILLKAVRNGLNDYEDLLICLETGNYLPLNYYDNNLKDKSYEIDYDVVKICDMNYVGYNFKKHIIDKEEYWTAVRDETQKELDEILEEINTKTEELNGLIKRYKELKDKEVNNENSNNSTNSIN